MQSRGSSVPRRLVYGISTILLTFCCSYFEHLLYSNILRKGFCFFYKLHSLLFILANTPMFFYGLQQIFVQIFLLLHDVRLSSTYQNHSILPDFVFLAYDTGIIIRTADMANSDSGAHIQNFRIIISQILL